MGYTMRDDDVVGLAVALNAETHRNGRELYFKYCPYCNGGGHDKDTFSVKKDTINKIDFTFQMPKLVNGDYVVGVAISEGSVLDFKVLTWLYNVLYMQITNVGNNDGILQLDTNIEIYSKGVENE